LTVNSKSKGKRGELEWVKKCKENGYEGVYRGQQYNGAKGNADVEGLPFIHCEVKRVEALNLYAAIEQSVSETPPWNLPVVAHKKNGKPWLVTMTADDWFKVYRLWEQHHLEVPFGEQDEDKVTEDGGK
jgi:hypothetical protein